MAYHCWPESVALDISSRSADGSSEMDLVECQDSVIQEPCVGMEFDSEDGAKEFYDEYARRAGFVMRIDQCRRSEVDKRILSRRLSCNKQGYYVRTKDQISPARKPRPSTREGCKAMMLVKDSKDRKIEDLTMALEHEDQLCDLYREQFVTLLENIEEQIELLS